MKSKSKFLFIAALIVLIFSTQAVMAENTDMTQSLAINGIDDSITYNNGIDYGDSVVNDANAVSNIKLADNEKLIATNNDLLSAEMGNFSELQQLINMAEENAVINLDKDYKYSGSGDANLIQIGKPVTINGNGHSIDGDNQKLLCYIPATGHDIVLNNISFVNGYYAGNTGGLWILGPNCVINNSVFDNNNANSAGAVFVGSGASNTEFLNCNFTNNKGLNYGSAYVNGPGAKFDNCEFTDNYGEYYAGAIYFSSRSVGSTVSNSTFTDNSASYYGGAICWTGSDGNVVDSTFTGNNIGAYGGAICWTGANGNVSNSTFTGNDANEGGAIYWAGPDGTVEDSTFTGNTITGVIGGGAIAWYGDKGTVTGSEFNSNAIEGDFGGAIYWEGADGNINYSNFTENSAASSGGAIYVNTEACTISDSKFKKNQAKWFGGAVYTTGDSTIIENCEFDENSASTEGGAVYASYAEISESNFTGNSADAGGAVYVKNDGFYIEGSNFNENTADNGGAVYCEGSNGDLYDCVFNNNSAINGGAVYLKGEGNYIDTSQFTDNRADQGGAVFVEGSENSIYESAFNNNSAVDGGAVYFSYSADSPFIYYDSTFTNNTADYGGAIFSEANNLKINYAVFDNNSATKGGAIYLDQGDDPIIVSSEFYNNDADEEGGAVYVNSPVNNAVINYDNFENNTADYGGAVYNLGSENEIQGSTFTNNSASRDAGAVYNAGVNNIIDDSEFHDNHADGNGGAVVWNNDNGEIKVSRFFNNDATNGGAVLWNGNNGTINNSYLADSNAGQDGGAVYWSGSNPHIIESGIHGNHAGRFGGAVYFDKNSNNAEIKDSKMNFNTASDCGGAIYWDSDDGSVNNTEFMNNYVYSFTEGLGHGGAIYWNGNNALVNNSHFAANSVYNNIDGSSKGGAILFKGNSATVNNTEFEFNQANTNGGAISWWGFDGTLDNSTFYKNTAYSIGGAVYWCGPNALINNSDFINNTAEFFTGGGVAFETDGDINNSRFINNSAHKGGGVYWSSLHGSINNSYFENNYAYYGGAGISCDYDYPNTDKVIANSEFVNNTAHDYGGAIASLDTEIINSTFKENKAHLGGAIHSYSSKISNSTFEDNSADYGNDLYYHTDPVLINTDVPESRIEVVNSSELIKIEYPIGNSTRMTNLSYVAMCVERYTYYPQYGIRDDTLRGLVNINTRENISEYLKLLVYTYFNSTDDILPHEDDNYTFYPEYYRDFPDRWDYVVKIPRPDYYSRAVHEFSDHDFRNSDHPVVQKVLELYDSGVRVPENNLKEFNGSCIEYDFTSMISPASQSLFLFKMIKHNMSVQKITLNKTVYIGNQTMFKIVVTNTGESNLTNITVHETEYEGLKLADFKADSLWSGNVTTGKFLYKGMLRPGENASFIVIFDTFKKGNFTNVVVASNNKTTNKTANNTTEVLAPLTFNVTKEWNDSNNHDGIKPLNVTVELRADGVVIKTAVVSEDTDWKASFKGLLIYKENTHIPINYTITEVPIKGYNSTIRTDGKGNWTVKNTHVPELVNVSVVKVWNDADNQDGVRADNVTVQLLKGDEVIDTVVL
ncbi:right-handed parallel beta-helix repeat-containing protein, partial [Methanobrevibacter sp.]